MYVGGMGVLKLKMKKHDYTCSNFVLMIAVMCVCSLFQIVSLGCVCEREGER